jgi:hypothetical protein
VGELKYGAEKVHVFWCSGRGTREFRICIYFSGVIWIDLTDMYNTTVYDMKLLMLVTPLNKNTFLDHGKINIHQG